MNSFHLADVECLTTRFPQMFSEPMVSMDFFSGWYPDFVDLCFEIDALLGNEKDSFYWCQLKEKFGSYRMRCAFRSPHGYPNPMALQSLHTEVRDLIGQARQKMDSKCCVCGVAAKLGQHGAWAVLCNYHSRDARRARNDFRSLRELAAVPLKPVHSDRWNTFM